MGADPGGERLEWEADLRHAQLMQSSRGLVGSSKSVTTPGVKGKVVPIDGQESESSVYKSVCMRGMYKAQDRPDIAVCKYGYES